MAPVIAEGLVLGVEDRAPLVLGRPGGSRGRRARATSGTSSSPVRSIRKKWRTVSNPAASRSARWPVSVSSAEGPHADGRARILARCPDTGAVHRPAAGARCRGRGVDTPGRPRPRCRRSGRRRARTRSTPVPATSRPSTSTRTMSLTGSAPSPPPISSSTLSGGREPRDPVRLVCGAEQHGQRLVVAMRRRRTWTEARGSPAPRPGRPAGTPRIVVTARLRTCAAYDRSPTCG